MVLLKAIASTEYTSCPTLFTFQYGSIKGFRTRHENDNVRIIYIPIWFY